MYTDHNLAYIIRVINDDQLTTIVVYIALRNDDMCRITQKKEEEDIQILSTCEQPIVMK